MATETTRVAALRVIDLDRLLLDTKLAVPLPRAGFVSRRNLINTARASDRRVVAVSAPSGYGKSSLLSEWAAAEARPVAWVSLDRFDDDPATLLSLLASAYVRATGGDPALVTDMRGHGTSVLGRAAPRLAASLWASPEPFVIMLDDLHELSSTACHDVLSVVIGGIPQGSQLVAASRVEQPHIPRLRASGETLEIGIVDLALDAVGAQHIFAEADVELTADGAEAITKHTEGWPVGLYLAAVIAHDTKDETVAVFGDDRYVADYLYRESLMGLSDEAQRFLRRTAVLDRFSAELCDAVLGASGAQSRLHALETANVFLIPLDRRREWYRYHPLFREFLQGELRETEPELILDLHLRAAEWYDSHGSAGMAIEHLLQTPDSDRCVRLVTEVALPTYQAGQMETVQRWITELGEDVVTAYPPLAVLAGWLAVMSGRPEEADRWAMVIEDASFDLTPADGTASFTSGRAMLRSFMCAAGPGQAVADAAVGLAQEPPSSVWRDQAICLAAEAQLLIGDVDRADALFTEASKLANTMGSTDTQVLSDAERAMIAMDSGRWVEAAGLSDRALSSVDDHHLDDYAISVIAFAGAARLALHRGDLATASTELTRAMRARQFCTSASPGLAVRVRLSLAKTYFAMADLATARHLMRETGDILQRRPALGTLVDEFSAFAGILEAGSKDTAGQAPLTPAELRLLPYLQTHLTMPEIGARLFISRNTVNTQVGSIYRKLGVSSRHGAVDRAMAIGLLGA